MQSENITEAGASNAALLQPFRWLGDGLELIDQRALPGEELWLRYDSSDAVAGAIRDMVVRGAPAIGIAAAYGLALAARDGHDVFLRACLTMEQARPTAVNLGWAVRRLQRVVRGVETWDASIVLDEAHAIASEDLAANRQMALHAAELIDLSRAWVYTHCNTGALATGGWGTALGVVRQLHAENRLMMVYAGETRPWLQGARLTAWELARDDIPYKLVVDSAAASLMADGRVDCVIVGADRICGDGTVFNKIGTYSLAVLAKHHNVPFYVIAPSSTLDPDCLDPEGVDIEEREPAEISQVRGQAIAPPGADAFNPVFDRTPYELITAIVTEQGRYLPND